MIASYMDESFDEPPSGIFAVGGIMGRGVAIFELERRWEQVLRRPDIDIEYFKASECENGNGQFTKFLTDTKNITAQDRLRLTAISHDFLRAIVAPRFDNSYLVIGGVGIVQQDFYEVIRDPKARAILGVDPYRLAYDFAMIQCAWAMKQLSTGDRISFVCDEHERYGPNAAEAYRNLKAKNPNAAMYMGTYSSADDKTCLPLQAADAAIYEIRRALNLELGYREGRLRKQFGVLTYRHGMFRITHSNKAQLLHIVATHQPGEPFDLDVLMDYEPPGEDIKLRVAKKTTTE